MRITKLLAAVIGFPMIIGSFALVVGGGIALAVPDDDGWVSAGPIRLQTDSAALVGDDLQIDFGETFADGRTFVSWGEIPAEIEITSRNGKDVFVGIATRDDARAYLDGVAIDRLTSFDHDHEVEHVLGTYQAIPPADTDIWVASSIDGLLEWDLHSGEWAIVAVNADGSPGLDVGVTGSAKIPFLTALGVVLLVLGVAGITAGSMLTYYGVRRARDPRPATPAAPPATPDPVVS